MMPDRVIKEIRHSIYNLINFVYKLRLGFINDL
jgi:hypothetical protein